MLVPRPVFVLAVVAVALGAPACASGGAAAADRPAPSRRALRAACADDYRRLCEGVRRGEGRIAACFEGHAQELSPACLEAVSAARAARSGAAGARPTE